MTICSKNFDPRLRLWLSRTALRAIKTRRSVWGQQGLWPSLSVTPRPTPKLQLEGGSKQRGIWFLISLSFMLYGYAKIYRY